VLLHRLGLVVALSALFAGGFAGVVRYADKVSGRDVPSQCHVSSNLSCFGPVLR